MSFADDFDQPGWTLAVLPDLQNYTRSDEHFPVLLETMEWLVRESRALGVRLVLQVGDLTNQNLEPEWRRARNAFRRLDGVLPYVLAVGNHDLGQDEVGGSRFTRMNQFFRAEDNPLNQRAMIGCFEEGRLENTVSRFRLGSVDWLVLSLEFGPRDPVLAWADGLLREPSGVPALLVTHEFIDHLSRVVKGEALRSTPETHNSPYLYGVALEEGGVNCGEEVWSRLVEPHSRIRLVLNGHYRPFELDRYGEIVPADGVAVAARTDFRRDGSVVHQHLINAQWAPRGGDGWIELFRFDPQGKLLHSKLVSPVLERAAV